MIALFTIIYCVGIWLVYVRMKIKPTPKNLAFSSVIGVIAIGTIVIFWRFSAPSADNLVVTRYTVQIVPQVRGPVTKIHAEPNVPLTKGKDILFEIQPDTYENTVNEVSASLQAAKNAVIQLEAGLTALKAATKKLKATAAAEKAELDVARGIQARDPGAVSELKVTQLEEQVTAANAAVDEAVANEDRAKAEVEASKNAVESLTAKLANAQFDLDQCTVYAPADGFVTNWQVREGTMAVPFPFAPMGTFIDTSRVRIVASFPQNVCRYIESGNDVEFSIRTRPGEVFSGHVEDIIQASGEGQFVTTGTLGSAADVGSDGEFIIKFQMDDQEVAENLAMGTAGTVVVYTNRGKPFHVISRVVVRMNAWMYYLIPF